MGSIAFDPADVIVGVDTHKHQHVGVALDGLGRRLGQRLVPATPAGYAELLTWAAGLGRVAVVGVEGSGSYGLGLARFLRRHDVTVLEVARPPRKGQRRLQGKSDPLKVARDTAVTAHSQAMITLKATLVTAIRGAGPGWPAPPSSVNVPVASRLLAHPATLAGLLGALAASTTRAPAWSRDGPPAGPPPPGASSPASRGATSRRSRVGRLRGPHRALGRLVQGLAGGRARPSPQPIRRPGPKLWHQP